MGKKIQVPVCTKTQVFEMDAGWEGATKDDVEAYILERMEVSLSPVFECRNSENEELCNSGIFTNSPESLMNAGLDTGYVVLVNLVENPGADYPEETFQADIMYVLDWNVEVFADSQQEAEKLVRENLAKCFQLEESSTAGYFEIEVVEI